MLAVIQSVSIADSILHVLRSCRKRQEGLAKRFKAFSGFVRVIDRLRRFGVENEPRKVFRDLDEGRPLFAEVPAEKLHQRRGVVEPRFAQGLLQSGMGDAAQGCFQNVRPLAAGMYGNRIGTAVRTMAVFTPGSRSYRLPCELSTRCADLGSGRFASYPIGQYLPELSGKVRLFLYIARFCGLTGLHGHGDNDTFGEPNASQQSERLDRIQKGTDSGSVPTPLRREVGNGNVALVGLQLVVLPA